MRPKILALAFVAFAALLSGCVRAPLLSKQAFDFKSTALFKLPCDDPAVLHAKADYKDDGLETDTNACNSTHMLRMVDNFLKIQESDDQRGIEGDTVADVRAKGFTIFVDPNFRVRRANTKPLYGNDALAAVGIGVAPPPLQTPADVKAYADFMAQHYGEEYYEKDMKQIVDRFCLNNRDSLEIGDDRTFSIVWRNGHVFKRVIKGGPVNNPRTERGFLLCPGTFIIDTVSGTAGTAAGGATKLLGF
jgi:hypothetical protein